MFFRNLFFGNLFFLKNRKIMQFVNRDREIALLKQIETQAQQSAKFTVITGRRRIGKTRLIREAFGDKMVYWFVSRKEEHLLAQEFDQTLRQFFNMPLVDETVSLSRVLEMAFVLSSERHFTLVIDEFQNFKYVNGQFFSELQKIWDIYKDKSKLNLIVSGSIISLMKKIFQSSSEPLFGRASRIMKLQPFDVLTLKKIFFSVAPGATNRDFLLFYVLTGGVPKYVEILVDERKTSFGQIAEFVFDKYSPFIEEGKNLLIEELGQDYAVYFSILDLIARGYNKRTDIENVLSRPIAGYLSRLENYFEVISRTFPVFSHKRRQVRYDLSDNFLKFWFYFIYRNWSLVEIENWQMLRKFFDLSFDRFAGKMLEKYFKEKLALSGEYTQIGSWWDRRGENEIDIVAVNQMEKKIDLFEVKLNPRKLDLRRLYSKAEALRRQFPDYSFDYKGLSLDDV